jgi:hypothetical protein
VRAQIGERLLGVCQQAGIHRGWSAAAVRPGRRNSPT